ncbi:Ig-like domain-containing protein [Pseudomonas sp. LB3P14]
MRKESVRANQSLLINGQFTDRLTGWKRGPINDDWISVEGLTYDGVEIKVVSTGNGASVSQDFVVPKDPGANAEYVLKFWCESRHIDPGWVHISGGSLPEPLEIEISPGRRRVDAQPLDYEPVKYEIRLDLAFKHLDVLTFSVTSPRSGADDYQQVLHTTKIGIELHLEPLVLPELTLDQQSHSPTAPLPLCLGADGSFFHQLGFEIAQGNAWLGTQASLTIDGNPQEAIVAEPDWEVDQSLEKRWSLRCPLVDDENPHLLTIKLWNQYTADPFPIAVSLWHHRLVFRDAQKPAYFPVVEDGQSVRMGVQVGSYYINQPREGHTVTWTVAGAGIQVTAVTDTNGWAYFDYAPFVAGIFTIVASVVSLYYTTGVVTQSFDVQALAKSPWPEVMALVGSESARWEAKTGYPNRGSTYPLWVKLPSMFAGTSLSLHWRGDSDTQLGVEVNPVLDEPVPVPDNLEMLWELKSADDLDGRFDLWLSCSNLLLPSPEKPMRLARNEVVVGGKREADKSPVVDEQERALMLVQAVHFVASGAGDPVQNALVEFEDPDGTRTATTTGAGGWASHWYQPDSAGDHVVTAYIKAHPDALPIEETFAVKAIATSLWNKEVKILLDGVEVERKTLGVLCRRGQTQTLKVVPVLNSPWIGGKVSLHWRGADPQNGLTISDLGTSKLLSAEGVEWTFSSEETTSKSSLFELQLRREGEAIVRELSGRLMFADPAKELSLMLDQVCAPLSGEKLHPCLAALHDFTVLPNELSPLVGLMLSLAWTETPADELDATVQPPVDTLQSVTAAGVTYALNFTASARAGRFKLTVSMPDLKFTAAATPMFLDHNKVRLEVLRDSAVDPVLGLDTAWIWAWVVSHFIGERVSGATVTWTAEGKSTEVKSDAEGWSGFAYDATTAGPQPVEASTFSLYDNSEDKRKTSVNVLGVDPWKVVSAIFDGQTPHILGTKTFFPRRKSGHVFEVTADDGNPLVGRTLTLGMIGNGPSALDIRFTQSNILGLAQIFAGVVQYPFKVGDLRDGSCAFHLGAERLARLSPEIRMSVGPGAQVWRISVVTRAAPTLYWGEWFKGEVKVISSISGKAMVGVEVRWHGGNGEAFTSVTNYYGVATWWFVPTIPGATEVTATVGEGAFSDSVKLQYELLEPREIASLTSPNQSVKPGEKISADITVVSALDGKALQGVVVDWEFLDFNIPSTSTDAEGKARVEFTSPPIIGELLIATVEGGNPGWQVKHIQFKGVPNV